MTALPATVPPRFDHSADFDAVKSAYDKCLREEQRLVECCQDSNTRWHLVCVRILGHLIHKSPTDDGVRQVVSAIDSCGEDVELHDLGGHYCQAWTRAFKSAKGRTPSNHPSRGSSDEEADTFGGTLDVVPESHAKAKELALIRDDHRCIVTGKRDRIAVTSDPKLIAKFTSGELSVDSDMAETQCAHIFSESSNWNISDVATDMWITMRCFGYELLPDELSGANVNRLENVMTLTADMRSMFDSFSIWFVPTVSPHTYKIETIPSHAIYAARYGPTVTFRTTDDKLPCPSPTYLKIHAACAQVAHLSGASKWANELGNNLDKYFRKTLANNGTSAPLLCNALWAHVLNGSTVA
ncbi:hypothetical protein D9619_008046 [Psilocybe cf. subviscida]|uniref:HNH nuclease domain-containing protein n=1 Tax=Psilocybe cf. subviscida TaxID=2480587 RepID=A0A8H5AUK0_9AGAR|nr:hypothetical protein D9619_008046 [Psilocybe cf. subviscida]